MQATVEGTFAAKLEAELRSRRWGLRTLARAIVDRKGEADAESRRRLIEQQRRTLTRYRRGENVPTTMTRELIEDVLKVERDSLKPDEEDDDEADQLVSDLLAGLRSLVRAEVERARERQAV